MVNINSGPLDQHFAAHVRIVLYVKVETVLLYLGPAKMHNLFGEICERVRWGSMAFNFNEGGYKCYHNYCKASGSSIYAYREIVNDQERPCTGLHTRDT